MWRLEAFVRLFVVAYYNCYLLLDSLIHFEDMYNTNWYIKGTAATSVRSILVSPSLYVGPINT